MNKFVTTSIVLVGLLGATMAFAEEGGLKWNGDFRFRHEAVQQGVPASLGNGANTVTSYHQERIQLRFGAKADVNESTKMEFRITTGNSQTSSNQTLTGNFNKYAINLDRAFFDMSKFGGHLYGGRTKNIFWTAGGSDLTWDSDVNFDGLAYSWSMKPMDGVEVGLTQAMYWATANTTARLEDNLLIAPQGTFKWKNDSFNLGFGLAYYNYTHAAGQPAASANANGNTTNASGGGNFYSSNYRVWNLGTEFGMNLGGKEFAAYIDYIKNGSAMALENAGGHGFVELGSKWGRLYGVKWGSLKTEGDYYVSFDWRKLGRDATIGLFSDADSAGGGTNIKSWRVKAGYQWAKNMSFAGAYYRGQVLDPGDAHRNKVQLDMNFMF